MHEMQRTELYNHQKDNNKVDSGRIFFQPKVLRLEVRLNRISQTFNKNNNELTLNFMSVLKA
jgi:hypothetical protein